MMPALATIASNGIPPSTEDGKETVIETSTPAGPKKPIPFVMFSCPLLSDKTLLPADKLILGAMLQYGYGSGVCTASNEAIGDACGMSGRSVRRRLPELSKWITIVRVEQSEANPVGREIYLDWTKDPARHPQQREGRIAKGGVANLATGGDGQLGHRIKPLTLSTRERDRSPLIPQGGTGSKKGKESPLSQFQRQRKSNSLQAVPEPPGPSAKPQPESIAAQPQLKADVQYLPHSDGLVRIATRLDGKWDRTDFVAAVADKIRGDLSGLAYDPREVRKAIDGYKARSPDRPESGADGHKVLSEADKVAIQARRKKAGITDSTATDLVRWYEKGGPLAAAAKKHLTPDMLDFMREQGGDFRTFAENYEREAMASAVGTSSGDGFIVPGAKVKNVIDLATALVESRESRLVDPFADGLVDCFGDQGSRTYFCKIGHRFRKQFQGQNAINLIAFRELLIRCLSADTLVENRAALFVRKFDGMLNGGSRRPAVSAGRLRQTA